MAIINTQLGGTDAQDDDVLDAADLNDTFDACNDRYIDSGTAYSTSASGEAEIAQATMAADTLVNGNKLLVTASGYCWRTDSNTAAITVKCRVGTDATGTNNPIFKTIERAMSVGNGGGGISVPATGWALQCLVDTGTWNATNYINITGASTSNHARVNCECLEVTRTQ